MEPGTWNPEHGTWNRKHAAAPWAPAVVLLVALMGATTGAPAKAQGLTDPTRPPAEIAVKAPAVEVGVVQLHQLQSVIISPTRRAAIIDGVVVELGAKYGDAVLTKVTEDEVVLRSDGSQEVLKLYPAVDIAPAGSKGAPRKAKPETKPNTAADSGMKARQEK